MNLGGFDVGCKARMGGRGTGRVTAGDLFDHPGSPDLGGLGTTTSGTLGLAVGGRGMVKEEEEEWARPQGR